MSNFSIDDDLLKHIKSLTFLCVDDSPTTLLMYESILKDIVKELIFAKDGDEGLEKYLNNDIDIIITDYEMPALNGLEMSEKIRALNHNIPILLVSAVQNVDIITKALNQDITGFIKKPIIPTELLYTISNTAKILIANRFLEEERESTLKNYEDKEKYINYQEDLAFAKELNILRNDFYYQMIDMNDYAFIDFFYQPLDTLSGDAYSARLVDENTNFYFIVDGMGKGLSASLSSMLVTSFINYLIDISTKFDLHKIIHESIEYIKPILLEDESLSISYIMHNNTNSTMSYATFAMPALLLQNNDGVIERIKSNNPPISKYNKDFKIDTYDIKNINKFLYYSDGIVENETRYDNKLYNEFIEEDFLNSYSREDMKNQIRMKIYEPEDDMTFIFINKPNLKANLVEEKIFECSLEELDNAFDWYQSIWEELTSDAILLENSSVAFTELYMNAFEHGNLGIDSDTKHQLLEDDLYFDTISDLEKNCNKKITVSVHKIKHFSNHFIITKITDMGDGFDTKILSKIFRQSRSFNGRGVFISRQSSHGIYYNSKGNSVIFLNKI